jgi:hypothetical protein
MWKGKGRDIARQLISVVSKNRVKGELRKFIDSMKTGKLRDKSSKFVGVIGVGRLGGELRKLTLAVGLEIIVFGVCLGIVARFFPDYTYIYDAIIIFFVCAIGITIMLYGNATSKRYLNVMGLLILLFAVYIMIETIEGFASKISAFATLAVAIAAFASFEENRRVRKDNAERESRDRRERAVDEAAKWLRELEGNVLSKPPAMAPRAENLVRTTGIDPKISLKDWLQMQEADRAVGEMITLATGIKEAEYYQKLMSNLDEGLGRSIGVIANEMEQRRQLHVENARYMGDLSWEAEKSQLIIELLEHDDKPLEGSGLSDKDISHVRLGRNAGAVRKSIRNALDKVIELKASFIRVR